METQPGHLQLPAPAQVQFEPDIEKIKKKLLKCGVFPTPKIIRNIRKKEIQKHNRKQAKIRSQALTPPLTPSQQQALAEEQHFLTLKREFKQFNRAVAAKTGEPLIGKPWERIERLKFRQLANNSTEFVGDNLKRENLRELKEMFDKDVNWVLDDDVEAGAGDCTENMERDPAKRWRSEAEAVRVLVDRLSVREMTLKNWKFVRIMKQSGLQFTEGQMLKILKGLGDKGSWRQAMSVVDWVYELKDKRDLKSRFVYTKLLAILGKEGRPREALRILNLMLEDCNIYPDIAAYHSAAVSLGQAGFLKELVKLIERMKQTPSKRIKNVRRKNWDPVLEPDLIVYNAVLNACVPSRQWKGVFWVFEQLRKSGLKPNGVTYGLAMEVMLQSGKYNLVHEFFRKMTKSGEALRALTYKVLVRAFWEEGKVNEAVAAVRDMEQRGVVGTASVYYELACCLCNNGRWQDAMSLVEKIKNLHHSRPLEITFTGLIKSSMDGGHIDDCIVIFQHMKDYCEPNVGTVNIMLKVYGKNDMFSKAKELFEETMRANSSYASLNGEGTSLKPDEYTYSSMLEASAAAHQWEYFEYVYKGMTLSGSQLDQTKHARLLVEASKAGKWHLLEHAFDSLLEAGEIPHPLFFTEMLIQVIVQNNYEKAVTLINTMAYAPFQITERQWTELFKSNEGRINQDSLVKLLDGLCNCIATSEITVSNLSRVLHVLCGSETGRDFSSSPDVDTQATDVSPLHGIHKAFDVDRTENVPSFSASMMCRNVESDLGADSLLQDVAVDMGSVNCLSGEDNANPEMFAKSLSYILQDDQSPNHVEGFADDAASSDYSDYLDEELAPLYSNEQSQAFGVVDFQKPIRKGGGSYRSKLPSAHEILEAWKESREKDGIFFPFEQGKK